MSNAMRARTLHSHLLPVAAALLALAACTVPVPRSGPGSPTSTPASSSRTAQVPIAAPPAGGAGFDPAHAAEVLSPAVGIVIVNTARGTAEGSGFAISVTGGTTYMATNNHVVDGARKVQVVMPDGRHFEVKVQGTDAFNDVAVLRVDAALPVAQFADSSQLKVGQQVVAIGSPLGSQGFGSVTAGVVSALHRTLTGVGGTNGASGENLADVLQTDAPINPGNSGGPLADGSGRVVGMNTAGNSSGNSIGFAIPSQIVRRVAENLIAGRTPGHPFVGISYASVEQALASQAVDGYGVVVRCTVPGSPADKAGVRAGDVIEKIDATDLNNGQTLGGVLQLHNPGDVVRMTLLRGSATSTVTVTLSDRPAQTTACR